MTGETDLSRMLATIGIDRRPGLFCFVKDRNGLALVAEASVREQEGLSLVVSLEHARANGIEPEFVAAWLTLRVHSALEAVGLTAAVSRVLTEENIPCNVIAGLHHDHLLVPVDRAEAAVVAIESLASTQTI